MLTGTCLCGDVGWTFDGHPGTATACNCTACRRYATLWIYDWVGGRIAVTGTTQSYVRPGGDAVLGFHFCPTCGCVSHWQGLGPNPDGRTRIAVNVRLSEPETVAHLPIRHFDGLVRFEDLPMDGRTVHDMWF
ncbi:GFA family protein [Psychromarinibacter halotolerans]|uniref:GFA family protein n=1 Tax=Psychromarinibacter halotolerans TaxID=1775175 RepID=A0ABV7GTG6_9RHOB|nr:GFA family protein [Psychromarinibacter halotolerans]MDF0597773.1 GFA family protein [Psychromarinibacter halotolerans]